MANVLNLGTGYDKGAKQIGRDVLSSIETPASTETWFPIPHKDLLEGVQGQLERSGLRVVNEIHGISREGARYFGMLQVANGKNADDYGLVVGLRNSHDKAFLAGLVVGAGVYVCDNLSFSGEVQIGRKHTRFIGRDLPGLIESAVGQISALRTSQDRRVSAYKTTEITDAQAHDLLIQAVDTRVLPNARIPQVLTEWRTPRHPEFAESKNGWRLFNAFTETLKGTNLFERPRATQVLHGLLDTACGVTLSKS